MDLITALVADQAVTAIVSASIILTGADLICGIGGAFGRGTFRSALVAEFVQSHVLARVLPILTCAALGHFYPPLLALAGTAAAAYTLETLGSVRDALRIETPTAG